MAEDGHAAGGAPTAHAAPGAPGAGGHGPADNLAINTQIKTNGSGPNGVALEEIASLTSPRLFTPNPFSRKNTSLDIDDYFVWTFLGPRADAHPCWLALTPGCYRPDPAISRSTRNGPSSYKCTAAFFPS